MSGATLNDFVEEEIKGVPNSPERYTEDDLYTSEEVPNGGDYLKKIITAETGEGSIGDYLEHPMNFNNSYGLAQMLRGVTGIAGNLKLAIIDIGFGFLRFSKERKGVIENDVSSRGDFPS